MEHICKTISSYDKIYTRKGYGIECDDCELEQREQALFYLKSRITNTVEQPCNLENSCIACGIDNNLSYNCTYLETTSTATNNLRAQVKATSYCYRVSSNSYAINLYLGIAFNNPAITISVANTATKYVNGDVVIKTGDILYDYGNELYTYSFTIPNNAASSLKVTVNTAVSDGITTLNFVNTIDIDKSCIL
jgi:hypothetical protein